MLKKLLTFAICLLFLSSIASGVFPTDWGRRCALVIQESKISDAGGDLTNFAVLFTKANLPAEMFAVAGAYEALEGGGDIRFSSDEAGSSRLACEIEKFSLDDADDVAEIWVNVPTVDKDGDTTIYIWYNKVGETQPAVGAAFGRNATWNANFLAVYHLGESAGTAVDSSGGGHAGTFNGGLPDQQAGQIYLCQDLTATGDYIITGATADFSVTSVTAEAWARTDLAGAGGTHTADTVIQKYSASNLGWKLGVDDNGLPIWLYYGDSGSCVDDVITSSGGSVVGSWHYLVGTRSTSGLELFVDSVSRGTDTQTCTHATESVPLHIGRWKDAATSSDFDGRIDEARVSDVVRADEWIGASFESQNDPNGFVVEGTAESPNGEGEGNAIFFGINFLVGLI